MDRYYVGCDRKGNESLNSNNTNSKGTGRTEITGLTRITKKRLKELCKKDKLYQTPALNDVLYLHYQGIDCIECLEEYTGLKCLWLECNAISEIQGLDNQKQLKCLFLQSNLIKRIENLENCPELDTLNLASNHIRKIENCGFDVLPVLSTLNLASNFLKDFDGLKDLENCKTLSVLDLSNNRIDDILVVKIFAKMPQLRVLVLQGNPVVSKLPQYRKTLILECKELTYLDSRPVFPKDRACAEAWKAGGYEGERKENNRWNRMERRKIRDSVNATIRMRNKHKPPDQQDALFNSSDSEEDLAESKRQRQAEIDAGINMELGIWEEVVNEDSKSETSSDMNISSSTSGLSTTDSNANISADSKSIELRANINKEEKIINNSPQTKIQVLDIARDANMGEILKVVNAKAPETENKEVSVGQKRVFIEERVEPPGDQASGEVSEIASCVVERLLDKEIIPAVVEKARQFDRCSAGVYNLSDSDDATKDEYNATVDAICKITMNDLSAPSPKKRIKLQIEVEETLDEDAAEESYEMLEETVEIKEQEVQEITEINASESVVNKKKTAEQIKYEQECEEVNQKVVDDFEELSTHMDNFIEEMQKNNEEMNAAKTPADDECSTKQVESETESTGTSHSEMEENAGNLQLLQRERSPEKYNACVTEHVARVEGVVSLESSQMYTNTDACIERKQEEGCNSSSGSGSDVPPEASSLPKVDLPNQLDTHLEPMRNYVPGDHGDMPMPLNEPTHIGSIEKADSENEKNVALRSPDFRRPQTTTNASYEREERELRQLLQKLEDENEQLYKINNAYRRVLEEDIREEIKYRDKESSDNSEKICEEIIQEMLNELTILDRSTMPQSYEFGDIESDEEYSYSDPPKPPEPPVRTIRDVLGSFNELLQEIARKNREEMERKECELNEALRRKHASTEAEKAASLQNLLNSPNLRDFNGDTNESLDQQIAVEKKRENERVRKLVDRVYAQKDRYNDTLEVLDGKLVVVKKDTGEIEELPESKLNYSDSEDSDAYESANSDNEAAGTDATRLWDAKVRREEQASGSFRLPYRPTERKSAIQLIQKANELKEKEEAEREAAEAEEGEEGKDKFYSLEPTKPAIFHNIDEEFIEKLDFEKAELEKQDENDKTETVECARSYTYLKQIMKANREELNLTDDENAMLRKMLGRAEKDEGAKQPAEENELLHKMVQRTKEKEKEAKQLEAEAACREAGAKPTLSKQTIKIMEFNKNNNSNTKESAEAEQAGNFMNIKQLNAEFPIPRAFRDMLDDYDLGTMSRHLADADPPELTLLYSKENKKKSAMSAGGSTEIVVCGNFENPLQLCRGGITLTTHHEGEEEEEFKELDTSYDDALPATDEDELSAAREPLEEKRNESNMQKEHADILQNSVDSGTSTEKCERISEVAAYVLKFDGTNYEEYGIDKETARGVVAYEKMLNFGYEEEEEFADASMQAEEMVKIVTEALQKDQMLEKGKGDGVIGEEPRVYFADLLAEDNAPNKESTKQLGDIPHPRSHYDDEEKPPSDDIEFQDLSEEYKDFLVVGTSSAETLGTTVGEVDEIATKSDSSTTVFQDFAEDYKDSSHGGGGGSALAFSNARVVDAVNMIADYKNCAGVTATQQSTASTEFQELPDDYKGFPNVDIRAVKTLEAADEVAETKDVNSADITVTEQTTNTTEFQDLSEDYKDSTIMGSYSPENIGTVEVVTDAQPLVENKAPADAVSIKQPSSTIEFQELSEDYKDFPPVDGSVAEVIEAAGMVENENLIDPTPNAPGTSDLTPKRSSTELEKRRSLRNLLKSPILKQFNDDTNESLDAQIQAAKENDDDFDVIECNLQVIDDNDEVIKEIAVNAEITYST